MLRERPGGEALMGGRGKAAGSPVFFHCFAARREVYGHRRDHTVELTGRIRRYRPPRGSAMGSRSMHVAFEYRCACGHVGWSNHRELWPFASRPPIMADDQWERAMDWAAARLNND